MRDCEKFYEEMKETVNGMNANVSVVFQDLSNPEMIFYHNENTRFPSASTIKVPIMLEALRQNSQGIISLRNEILIKKEDIAEFSVITAINKNSFSVDELIVWMIIESDNTATNSLIRVLGVDNINNMISLLGMANSCLQRKMMDFDAIQKGRNNMTTALDMLTMLKNIYDGRVLTREICDEAISILKRQRNRDSLLRYICDDVSLANKPGGLDHINHDIGIFYLQEGNYVLGVFVTDVDTNEHGKHMIATISLLFYRFWKQRRGAL